MIGLREFWYRTYVLGGKRLEKKKPVRTDSRKSLYRHRTKVLVEVYHTFL